MIEYTTLIHIILTISTAIVIGFVLGVLSKKVSFKIKDKNKNKE